MYKNPSESRCVAEEIQIHESVVRPTLCYVTLSGVIKMYRD